MTKIVFILSGSLFNDKQRVFHSKQELKEFLNRKLNKIAEYEIDYKTRLKKLNKEKKYTMNQELKQDIDDEINSLESEKTKMIQQLKKDVKIKGVKQMNISSNAKYPGNALSNFAPHPFTLDGIECASMEGFLQSLKTKSPEQQAHICTLVGRAAKSAGQNKTSWKRDQTLYWQGVAYKRSSDDYQQLLTRAFDALGHNSGFQRALLATGNATLEHSIGKRKQADTVLTRKEFINQLTRLRQNLKNEVK